MHHCNYGNSSFFLLCIVDKAIGGNGTGNFKVLMAPPVFYGNLKVPCLLNFEHRKSVFYMYTQQYMFAWIANNTFPKAH